MQPSESSASPDQHLLRREARCVILKVVKSTAQSNESILKT